MYVGQFLSLQTMSVVRRGVVRRYSPVNCSVHVKTGKTYTGYLYGLLLQPYGLCHASINPAGAYEFL